MNYWLSDLKHAPQVGKGRRITLELTLLDSLNTGLVSGGGHQGSSMSGSPRLPEITFTHILT